MTDHEIAAVNVLNRAREQYQRVRLDTETTRTYLHRVGLTIAEAQVHATLAVAQRLDTLIGVAEDGGISVRQVR